MRSGISVLTGKSNINSKNIISASFCVISAVAIVLSVVFGGVRLAYNIKFNDKVITTVSDKKVYYAAVSLVADMVECENIDEVLPEVKIDTVVTLNQTAETCEEVAGAIIDNTDEIVSASRLIIDGVDAGCADTEKLNSALEEKKAQYNIDGLECESKFCADVRLEEGYFLESELSDISSLGETISSLDVMTVSRVSSEQSVAYKTVINKSADKQTGYVNVEQKGENGINRVVSGIVYINGEVTEKTTESVEVVKEPVDEIVTVGTMKSSSKTGKSGFVFPLPSGSWEVSCPYGKNGHKGVDLRAPNGTSIMAAASGKVTLAGRYRDYGNCVIIDHGNGIQTLYAHASKLCVNTGDIVSAGDVIALVGSTGNSTGNHLHFEVYIGSDRVNPQPYIGLK
ncbi:MAG: peptidoglycan DD-metalloendopeptidase family protein [Clostridia bacterium]|nr:peptidoglycan DD-metalloendopeptidase family protein [Clostridia bacterium]